MSIIKIDNFGGEMPSASARALPPGSAQTNSNLYLATQEFRPLKDDSTVASGMTSGAKSLFRIDSSTAWLHSTEERSYVRGQVNGLTDKRTFFSTDSSTTTALKSVDNTGAVRDLGVTPPAKPVVTVTDRPVLYLEDLAYWVRVKTADMMTGYTDAGRRYSGATTHAGPTVTSGFLFANAASPFPTALNTQHWNLFVKILVSRAVELQLDIVALNGTYATEAGPTYYVYIPLTCVPYTFRQFTPLDTTLATIINPRTSAQALSAGQIDTIQAAVELALNPAGYAYSQRIELTHLSMAFLSMLTGYTPAVDENLGPITLQIKALQDRAETVTKEVEALGDALWSQIAQDNAWALERLYELGGADSIPAVDAPRMYESRFYLTTIVTDRGEESAPSPVSDMYEIDQYDTVSVAVPVAPTHGAFMRVYRSSAGANSAAFLYAGEKALTGSTQSFSDTFEADELGEPIQTTTWAAPEAGLRFLRAMPNGIMAAAKDNTIHFCEPYVPYAWPVEYQITTKHPVTGLGVFGQTLVVLTEAGPVYITGSDSASMTEQTLDSNQTCASHRSIAPVQNGVLFASPDGLCVADNSGVRVISQGMFTRADWQALAPTTMYGIEHENIYYLFYVVSTVVYCLTFDLATKKLGRLTGATGITALYVDRVTDELYAISGTSLKKIHGNAAVTRQGVWKSPKVALPKHETFSWLKVLGDQDVGHPVVITLYGDGVQLSWTEGATLSPTVKNTFSLTSTDPVRVPALRCLEYEVQVSSQSRITQVVLASTTQELQAS